MALRGTHATKNNGCQAPLVPVLTRALQAARFLKVGTKLLLQSKVTKKLNVSCYSHDIKLLTVFIVLHIPVVIMHD